MTSADPPRIASGRAAFPGALRDAVQAAATDGPTPQEIERLASALAPVFAAPPLGLHGGGHGATASGVTGVKGFGAGKTVTTLAVAALVGAGGYGAWLWLRPAPTPPQNIAPAVAAESEPAPELPAPPPIAVESLPQVVEPVPTGAAVPVKPREAMRVRPIEAPPQETQAAEPPKGQSESELVDLARRSVASDPRKALALAQDHHRRFAGGPLSEEADFIEIEAMKRLGRFEEARALDDRFRKRYPTSIHGQTVQVRPSPTP
jgi:hypothetical protein